MCQDVKNRYAKCGCKEFVKHDNCDDFGTGRCFGSKGDDKIVEQSGDSSKCIEKEKDTQRAQNLDPFGTVARQKARDEEKARNEKK